jgi:ferrochelatase
LADRNRKSIGVILLNLGGPDSLKAVRPFLYNLFSDRDIIRLGPSFLQRPIAWLISRFRSGKTEEMYSQIGGKSPILDITGAQARALEKAIGFEMASRSTHPLFTEEAIKVYIGMRYWHPFVDETIETITNDGITDLVALSLYPHYSKATTGSSIAEFERIIKDRNIDVTYIREWYDFEPYIDSLAALISAGVSEFNGSDFQMLYSAHSLPESFISEGDPYLDHIKTTIDNVNKKLAGPTYNVSVPAWHLSFQSKTGPVRWLEPSTEEKIIELADKGCKNLFVIPVSFVSDHIETLYEIDILYKSLAEEHGIKLKRCEALNTNEKFIHALKQLVIEKGGLGAGYS